MTREDLLPELTAWGADTEGAMDRMLDDLDFYIECIDAFMDSPSFKSLQHAIENRVVRPAFEAAHDIKGITGTLGLTPMYKIACDMTEPLRAGTLEGAQERFEALSLRYSELEALLRRCEARA